MSAHGSSMHQKCSNYALTNLLYNLCRFVRIINLLVICPNPHIGAPTCHSTPKVLWIRVHTPTIYPFAIFTFGLVIESIKEFGGALNAHLLSNHVLLQYKYEQNGLKNTYQRLLFISNIIFKIWNLFWSSYHNNLSQFSSSNLVPFSINQTHKK
jgi:hypothetical protein